MVLIVTVESGPPNWSVGCADEGLGGAVVATGETRDDAIRQFRSALQFHLESLKNNGLDAPVVEGLEIRELIPV